MEDTENTQYISLEMTIDCAGQDTGTKIFQVLDVGETCLERLGLRVTGVSLLLDGVKFEAERDFREQSAQALCVELNELLSALLPGAAAKFVLCMISERR